MGVVEAIVLGIVQGITEWLPVSSTAHLRVVPALFGWSDPGAAFTAVSQLGTTLALLIYFGKDLVSAISGWAKSLTNAALRETPEARLGWGVFWGTIPVIVAALVFQKSIEGSLRSLYVIAGTLIGFGLIMLWADRTQSGKRTMESVKVGDGLWVGLFQCLSLIPGVSRSGSTMTGAYLAGFDRSTAARYSFMLSVPSVTAAGVYELLKYRHDIMGASLTPILVATAVAFVVGYASIAWLMKFLQKHGLGVFVGYRVLVGVVLLILLQTGVLTANAGATTEQPAPSTNVSP
ncbi:MAG: undecaprenyl-diphosphate phosphatase [Fimbriimonadales bacterium]